MTPVWFELHGRAVGDVLDDERARLLALPDPLPSTERRRSSREGEGGPAKMALGLDHCGDDVVPGR
jgi:hypothetical protein